MVIWIVLLGKAGVVSSTQLQNKSNLSYARPDEKLLKEQKGLQECHARLFAVGQS